MYSLPSTSVMRAPLADLMNRGVPPTPMKLRAGELTPPGISSCEHANNSADARVVTAAATVTLFAPLSRSAPHQARSPNMASTGCS